MKTYYCVEDIEKLAAQGKGELIVDEDTVLTDLARDVAQQLGISLVYRSLSTLVTAPPSVPSTSWGSTVGLGAKPKGCQHGPLTSSQSEQTTVSNSSDAVVDQLVNVVRQLGSKGSGD